MNSQLLAPFFVCVPLEKGPEMRIQCTPVFGKLVLSENTGREVEKWDRGGEGGVHIRVCHQARWQGG